METRCIKCGRPFSKQRSNPQNSYYWSVVIGLISEHTGFTPEETHEILKHKFLRITLWIPKKDGVKEMSVITKTTTKLTTKAFEEYLSQIRIWASQDLGCFIPSPNESLEVIK